MGNPPISKDKLYEEYIINGKTRYEIGREYDISPAKIGSLLQRFRIKRYSAVRHGLVNHPLNAVWCGMKERCYNENADNYKWYGGSGITVCEEWSDFKQFYDWAIANGWQRGLSIDRIDTLKGYSPDNCRFVTHKEQCRNRRTNVYITVDGETHMQCEWAELLGLNRSEIAKWKSRHGMEYVINRIRKEMTSHDD